MKKNNHSDERIKHTGIFCPECGAEEDQCGQTGHESNCSMLVHHMPQNNQISTEILEDGSAKNNDADEIEMVINLGMDLDVLTMIDEALENFKAGHVSDPINLELFKGK
jgi:hypothetical protein